MKERASGASNIFRRKRDVTNIKPLIIETMLFLLWQLQSAASLQYANEEIGGTPNLLATGGGK